MSYERPTNRENGNWWVGDPCYAIPDSRWEEFCNLLFAKSDYKNNSWPVFLDWEHDGDTYCLEIWNSPGGDGVWRFPWGVSLGVDAGLLSVLPEDVVIPDDYGGYWFEKQPSLETSSYDYKVWLNGRVDDSWFECNNCGNEVQADTLDDSCYCEECAYYEN